MRGQRATTPEISNYSLILWNETSTALIFFFQLLAIKIIVLSKQLILHYIGYNKTKATAFPKPARFNSTSTKMIAMWTHILECGM